MMIWWYMNIFWMNWDDNYTHHHWTAKNMDGVHAAKIRMPLTSRMGATWEDHPSWCANDGAQLSRCFDFWPTLFTSMRWSPSIPEVFFAGWWCNVPILKNYEFVNGKDDIPYMKWNKKNHVWNHQPVWMGFSSRNILGSFFTRLPSRYRLVPSNSDLASSQLLASTQQLKAEVKVKGSAFLRFANSLLMGQSIPNELFMDYPRFDFTYFARVD